MASTAGAGIEEPITAKAETKARTATDVWRCIKPSPPAWELLFVMSALTVGQQRARMNVPTWERDAWCKLQLPRCIRRHVSTTGSMGSAPGTMRRLGARRVYHRTA